MTGISLLSRRIRGIRSALGISRKDFARSLWTSSKSVMEWENGKRSPVGMHRRLLSLWEQSLVSLPVRSALQDPRATDPMFLLFVLLRPFYGRRVEIDFPITDNKVSKLARKCAKRGRSGENLTANRIRGIRQDLGFSQGEFAQILWVTYSTLSRWEHGHASPFGMHLRILNLLEENVNRPYFKAILRTPRRADHLYLLHQLLEPQYGDRPIIKPRQQ